MSLAPFNALVPFAGRAERTKLTSIGEPPCLALRDLRPYAPAAVAPRLGAPRYGLRQIGEAYRVFSNREDGVLKVAITP